MRLVNFYAQNIDNYLRRTIAKPNLIVNGDELAVITLNVYNISIILIF